MIRGGGMSLLLRGNELVTFYPEVIHIDADGNTNTRASDMSGPGITVNAVVQAAAQSGTSARRAEQDEEGFESEEIYRVRVARADDDALGYVGPQGRVRWRGDEWEVFGHPKIYNGSFRTRHRDFLIRRT